MFSGEAQVLFDKQTMPGAQRMVQFNLEEAIFIPGNQNVKSLTYINIL